MNLLAIGLFAALSWYRLPDGSYRQLDDSTSIPGKLQAVKVVGEWEQVTVSETNVTDRAALTGDALLAYQLEASFKASLMELGTTNLVRGALPSVIAKGQAKVDGAANDRNAASQASKNASLVALWVMLEKLGVDIYSPSLGNRYATNVTERTEWRQK